MLEGKRALRRPFFLGAAAKSALTWRFKCYEAAQRFLHALRATQFGEISVEGAERQMTGFAGNFKNQAIGEAQ